MLDDTAVGDTLAGGYNPTERENEVKRKLMEELKIFESHDFAKDGPVHFKESQMQQEKSLESLSKQIDDLWNAVESIEFEGKHFSKEYRTYIGECNRLLLELDNIEQQSGEYVAAQKQGITKVNSILHMLKGKVHEGGECCVNCELYGTIWQ